MNFQHGVLTIRPLYSYPLVYFSIISYQILKTSTFSRRLVTLFFLVFGSREFRQRYLVIRRQLEYTFLIVMLGIDPNYFSMLS